MRERIVEADVIEAVIGLGPNLFYNSPMEACVVVCRSKKINSRKGHVLFINAVSEVSRERTQSFLTSSNRGRILAAYRSFTTEPGFAATATLSEITTKGYNLSIPLYVRQISSGVHHTDLPNALQAWRDISADLKVAASELLDLINAREVLS